MLDLTLGFFSFFFSFGNSGKGEIFVCEKIWLEQAGKMLVTKIGWTRPGLWNLLRFISGRAECFRKIFFMLPSTAVLLSGLLEKRESRNGKWNTIVFWEDKFHVFQKWIVISSRIISMRKLFEDKEVFCIVVVNNFSTVTRDWQKRKISELQFIGFTRKYLEKGEFH